MSDTTNPPREPLSGAESTASALVRAAFAARARLNAGRDDSLAQSAQVARAQLGNVIAVRELNALARYERTGGIPQKRDRKSGGGTATCGRCGSFLPGDMHCRSCGHHNAQGEHHGSVRRPR